MKRFLLVSFILAAVGSGGYFLWQHFHRPPVKAWDLVPEDAILVYEHNRNSQEGTQHWIRTWLPDSLLANLSSARELLISVHATGKSEAAAIFYVPGLAGSKVVARLKAAGARERVFEGAGILEATINGTALSCFTVDDFAVVSTSSVLTEDVVRIVRAKEPAGFATSNKAIFHFTRMEWNNGRVYLNLLQAPGALSLFAADDHNLIWLQRLAKSGVIDLERNDQMVSISGFATDSISSAPSVLSVFNRQHPVSLTLPRMTSSRAGWLFHFGISDMQAWTADRNAMAKSMLPASADSLDAVKEKRGFDAQKFYAGLGNEVGLCQGGIFAGDLLLVRVANDQPEKELRKLQMAVSTGTLSESYSHYEIRSLGGSGPCAMLFWPLCSVPMNYYVLVDRHLVFAQQLDDLKAFLDDIDSDNTWGKSTEWNKFLSNTQETNAGVIIDGLNAWPSLKSHLRRKWQLFGDSSRFLHLNRGSLQVSKLEKDYYISGSLQFDAHRSKGAPEEKDKSVELALARPLETPITIVRNHTNGNSEVLFEDEGHNLWLFSTALKKLFSTPLDGRITSDVFQIDIYRNRKLQYLFATEKAVWLIDRTGNPVSGFPLPIPGGKPVQYMTVEDPANARDYRLLVTDSKNVINSYNLKGKVSSGWKSIEFPDDLWLPPRMIRDKGKDLIVAVSKKGLVYLYSGSGEPLGGYPVQLKVRPSGDWFFQSLDGKSLLSIVSDDGVLVQLDIKTKAVSRAHLIKSSAASRFSLVPSSSRSSFVIGRVDRERFSILKPTGDALFEQENPGSEAMTITYFETDQKQKLFAFSDPQQDFTYFYDGNGDAIFSRPLENQQRPAIAVEKSGNIYFYGVMRDRIQSYRRSRLH